MWRLLLFLALPLFAEPVAVYLTWTEQPDTTMTIQWLSEKLEDSLEYRRMGETAWKSAKASHAPMPAKIPYLIHRVELEGLMPWTDYSFRIDKEQFRFRTMPATQLCPIRFVVGGDVYNDGFEILEKMNRQVSEQEPMFVLLGGDLVYNERSKKVSRWIEWLMACKKQLVTPSGRLIPIIPAIGNHDVEAAPFFTSLFPMPGEKSYGVLDFGNYLSVIILDTDHLHPIAGAQTSWLKETLEKREEIPHKLALYHVPAYPCARDYHNSTSEAVRKNWVPLFDLFHLPMAFENHDHAYKRTWPLKNGKVDPAGVIYMGDGGWAVKKPRTPKSAWYLAQAKASRNVVLVILHGDGRHFIALDDEGKIIDECYQKVL